MAMITKLFSAASRVADEQDKLTETLQDPKVKDEFEFFIKLHELARKYEFTSIEIIQVLDPGRDVSVFDDNPSKRSKRHTSERSRTRPLKIYRHPQTGEVIETRGTNHKLLKEWKNTHGSEVVESWREA